MTSFVAAVASDGDADPTSPYKITMAILRGKQKWLSSKKPLGC
jgi:hypothetical protein